MKSLVSLVLAASMILTVCSGGGRFNVLAQECDTCQSPSIPKELLKKLPRSANVGASPEARAAWERATPEQRAKAHKKLREVMGRVMKDVARGRYAPNRKPITWKDIIKGKVSGDDEDAPLTFTDKEGKHQTVKAKGRELSASLDSSQSGSNQTTSNQTTSLRADDQCIIYPEMCEPDPCIINPELCNPDPCLTDPTLCSGNQPPQVSVAASATSGTVPLTVNFNANAYDPDGYITSYNWNFGDGETAAGAQVTHTYQSLGTFTATVTVTDNAGASASSSVTITVTSSPVSGADADADGLPDDFENQVADFFTPIYHVSAGERAGTGFATFYDAVPQQVRDVYNPYVPPSPISHYRVTPLGFATNAYGVQYSVAQIDYLTLWNRDDGPDADADCYILLGLLGFSAVEIARILTDHAIDNERPAILVAAPTSNYAFNTDPSAYSAYAVFTTAHEDEFLFDQSRVRFPDYPIPAGSHVNLWLSRSKHGTFTFHPEHYPMFRLQIILATLSEIDFMYAFGWITEFEYLLIAYAADAVFFSCFVEHFSEIGGAFSGLRINVGELTLPINGSSFILDEKLRDKLNKRFTQIYLR